MLLPRPSMMANVTHPILCRLQAIELLAKTQECSKYFGDFDFQQLLDLVHELTILYFKEGETVLLQGEPATFFGVLLKGVLTPMIGDVPVGALRGVGDIIGEMSLFSGGTRNVSVVASEDGYLAVVPFTQLERLKKSNPTLATKLNTQLANAALEKQFESDGIDFSRISEQQRQHGVRELLAKQAQQGWDANTPLDLKKQESLLRKASKASTRRKDLDDPSRRTSGTPKVRRCQVHSCLVPA